MNSIQDNPSSEDTDRTNDSDHYVAHYLSYFDEYVYCIEDNLSNYDTSNGLDYFVCTEDTSSKKIACLYHNHFYYVEVNDCLQE